MNEVIREPPELIELAERYDFITRHLATSFKKQLELARAEGDREEAIKNEIKLGVLIAARGLFSGEYRLVAKSKPAGNWGEV
jgi:hypothetical protein